MYELISNSVGRKDGVNAFNFPEDVKTVQLLLIVASQNLNEPAYHPGEPDGEIAPASEFSPTVAAIAAFQKRFMPSPDGQVDSMQLTMEKMNEAAAGSELQQTLLAAVTDKGGKVSLNSYLGKSMKEICPNGFDDEKASHCAHFVSHVLNIQVGFTCDGLTPKEMHHGDGACVRVQEIFAACPAKMKYSNRLKRRSGLMFISGENNFVTVGRETTLKNVPKKHIGIFHQGTVWHYSNTRNKVITQTPEEFIHHYRGQTNALWFGTVPAGAIQKFDA